MRLQQDGFRAEVNKELKQKGIDLGGGDVDKLGI